MIARRARALLIAPLLGALLAGCAHPAPPDLTFSWYNAPDFAWPGVARLLVLPLVNETTYYPQSAGNLQTLLSAELQQLGRFEVVPIPPDQRSHLAEVVRQNGRFPEAEVIELARCTRADAILVGTVTQYSPYFRPRVGLTLQVVSPDLARVVASADGLWDANNLSIADRARCYYARQKTPAQQVRDYVCGIFDDSYGCELVLESPHLFGRFVCAEAVRLLVGDPALRSRLQPPPESDHPLTPVGKFFAKDPG